MKQIFAFIVFSIISVSGKAETKLSDLVEEHYKIVRGSDEMFQYSLKIQRLIWAEWRLIDKCAPNGVVVVSDFLYKVDMSGRLINAWHFPETEVSKCVESRLSKLSLPKPAIEYIGLENIQSGH
ncbi:hypothetical protein PVT68_18165 [Microbulbifer bruguierae]|uniref:Uncharacterized protein n=1 Tax=Microbulbifer bruguierae TaxID=3029061 RepID=A0ABY8NCZ1_9GAMM|nr:hypothetical protein [Microbulbifer bruguierae]WGL16663.1 hypothetical protein PVT68_18165 [Microbulbifer bruguierae]